MILVVYNQVAPAVSTASSVSFDKDQFAVAPADKGNPPVDRQLLFRQPG